MPDRAAAPDDPLFDRTRELAEARASIAHLQVENVALRARLQALLPGDLPAPALLPPPAAPLVSPTAYRSEDADRRLDRELDEANLQLVNLSMDNAILRDRADPLERARQRRLRGVAAPLAAAAGVGFLWFVTGNVFILIPALILLLMLRGLLRLIDTIKPTDPGSRTPPQLPPPGMGL
jgi:hypothetical protein